jgi:hypothetical protein
VLGSIGLTSFGLGGLGMIYLAITWVINWFLPRSFEPLHQRPLLIYSVAALLLGTQMLTMGFLAELFTAHNARHSDEYSIAETIQPPEKPAAIAGVHAADGRGRRGGVRPHLPCGTCFRAGHVPGRGGQIARRPAARLAENAARANADVLVE